MTPPPTIGLPEAFNQVYKLDLEVAVRVTGYLLQKLHHEVTDELLTCNYLFIFE